MTMTHTGKMSEFFAFDFELDQPIEYTEPRERWHSAKTTPTIWRYTSIRITFTRDQGKPEGEWSDWHTVIKGSARNVLKSGELGQRTPSSYDHHLTINDRYDRTAKVAEWCRETVEPLLVQARAAVAQQSWDEAW